jgi:UDP-glucose:(heptosyl)LPS alpha-1,3-glucosyltransferase
MGLKIALIIERADIALGGAERSVFELASALMAEGQEVEILAAKGQTQARHIRILCGDERGRRVRFSAFGKALQEHLAGNNYDIVHSVLPYEFADVYQPRGGSYAETIRRSAASYGNACMEWYKRATAWANWRRGVLLRAERRLCRKARGPVVAALSGYVAEQFMRHYGLDGERVVVIANGVRTHGEGDKDEADSLRSQIMAKLRLKEADRPAFFLFVANNFRLKGLGPLMKAMRVVSARQTERPAFVVAAGSGGSRKWRILAARYGVSDRIIFLGKIRHIANAFEISDVAILPTYYDPSSRFILEALAAGRPVITTSFNGASDMFENGRHGRMIESPDNIEGLAEAIGHFTSTENIRQASEAIAADGVREKVSIARAAKELCGLYEAIIRKRGQ